MPKPFFIKKIDIDQIIRVDHAGELGANYIYCGQKKYIEKPYKELVDHMLSQEIVHLNYFNNAILEFDVRPTILISFWKKLGYLLGAVSAKFGIAYAMLLTEAVEDVIEEHYQSQIDFLEQSPNIYQDLKQHIAQFKQEESDHKHIAIEFDEEKSYFNKLFFRIIQFFCKQSILVSRYI